MEHIHGGFEHHEEVEQIEGIGIVVGLIEVENGIGNEFVDERLGPAGHGTMTVAEVVEINEGPAVVIETALDLGGGHLRQTLLVVLLKHPNDGKGGKSSLKGSFLWQSVAEGCNEGAQMRLGERKTLKLVAQLFIRHRGDTIHHVVHNSCRNH